jgi:hypothetical protein
MVNYSSWCGYKVALGPGMKHLKGRQANYQAFPPVVLSVVFYLVLPAKSA